MSSHAAFLMIVLALPGIAAAKGPDFDSLVAQAISPDGQASAAAIARLRDLGPAGLAAIVDRCGTAIEAHKASLASPRPQDAGVRVEEHAHPDDPSWGRISGALDRVGAQHDTWSAGLYWYTDLEQAKAAALATGRPILSLRLLGRLDEDRSCANSRFMRTALYANRELSRQLRDGFVLHWESVRPVPVITIDFGDGRSLVTTITGNSIHYLLDAEGRPIEALPGLCGPEAFGDWLTRASALHDQLRTADAFSRDWVLRRHHDRSFGRIVSSWQSDLTAAAESSRELSAGVFAVVFPTALEAAPVATTKMFVERPLIEAMLPAAERLAAGTPDGAWDDLAARHLAGARLDEGSLALMSAKLGAAPSPDMVERFERSLALDTVRNEYLLHRRLHEWFAQGQVEDVAGLNDRVYAELFLTPKSDPWLGLLAAGTYTALCP